MTIKTLPNGDTEAFSLHITSMVPEQPQALRLADWLERRTMKMLQDRQAAAELRRLHEAHEWQYTMAGERLRRIEKDEALLRQALEALEASLGWPHVIEALRERLGVED